MTQRNVATVLQRVINKLDDALESEEVAMNGISLVVLEDMSNDLKGVRNVLFQMVEKIGVV